MKQLFIALFFLSLTAGAMENDRDYRPIFFGNHDDNNDNNNNNNVDLRHLTAAELLVYLSNNLHFIDEYYENLFMANHIDGRKFFTLTLNQLRDLGVIIVGNRLSLFRIINEYNHPNN